MKTILAYCALALTLALAPAAHADVASSQQGLHQWPALKGKLVMVAGTVSDALRHKRSMTFYFESKPGADWVHVPIVKSQDDQEETWYNASHGETTVVVIATGDAGASSRSATPAIEASGTEIFYLF